MTLRSVSTQAFRALALALLAGCSAAAPPLAPASPSPPRGTPSEGPSGAPKEALAWAELGPAAFAKAKADRRLVVVDGSAEWCHWCHVMEATSYHDPEVRKILDAHFVAVKVDVDSRPDFEERYGAWGWPATVLMTADGDEIGKYKGYLAPEAFADILKAAIAGAARGTAPPPAPEPARPLTPAELALARARVVRQLGEYYDVKQGSWGTPQKAMLGWDDAWTLSIARAGSARERERALFTLEQETGLIDAVWGGVCQYSTDADWRHPHHEKLMTVQAAAIANYSEAYALTRDARWLTTAQQVRRFVDGFMTSPEGGFATTMDADLHAHDEGKVYVKGDDYYAKTDAERRALGIPRVDAAEYARENGLAIAAYVALAQASGDETALTTARRAAARVLATHASPKGGLTHGAKPDDDGKVLYLADSAAFGYGLMRLYEATGDLSALDAAGKIGAFVVDELADPVGGGFYASTPDPGAVGIFALRRKPFEDNVMAVRFLTRLAAVRGSDRLRPIVARTLGLVTRPAAVEERGRMVGDLLLAIDEAGGG